MIDDCVGTPLERGCLWPGDVIASWMPFHDLFKSLVNKLDQRNPICGQRVHLKRAWVLSRNISKPAPEDKTSYELFAVFSITGGVIVR